MIYLDAQDNIVGKDTPNAKPILVSIVDDCLCAMVRAESREVFHAQARAVGLMVEVDVDGEMVWRVHPNVDVTEEEPDPGDPRSSEMPRVEVSPGVFDTRYHANFRLNAFATQAKAWPTWAKAWTDYGVPAEANNAEVAKALQGIELIDPDTVASPRNRFG